MDAILIAVGCFLEMPELQTSVRSLMGEPPHTFGESSITHLH
jgi:hypothetical protein